MKFNLIQFIYSKKAWFFYEFDFKDLKMDWENLYGIIFDEYSDKDYELLDDTLYRIRGKEQPFTIDEIERRLDAGHMLFTAKKDNEIIGFFWVGTNYIEFPYLHGCMNLSKEEVVDYNNYVVEEYRGKRIISGLKKYAFNNLKNKGYKKAFSIIHFKNKKSFDAHERIGFRRIGTITRTIIMALEFRYHNILTEKIVFVGGVWVLWKGLFKKVKKKYLSIKKHHKY